MGLPHRVLSLAKAASRWTGLLSPRRAAYAATDAASTGRRSSPKAPTASVPIRGSCGGSEGVGEEGCVLETAIQSGAGEDREMARRRRPRAPLSIEPARLPHPRTHPFQGSGDDRLPHGPRDVRAACARATMMKFKFCRLPAHTFSLDPRPSMSSQWPSGPPPPGDPRMPVAAPGAVFYPPPPPGMPMPPPPPPGGYPSWGGWMPPPPPGMMGMPMPPPPPGYHGGGGAPPPQGMWMPPPPPPGYAGMGHGGPGAPGGYFPPPPPPPPRMAGAPHADDPSSRRMMEDVSVRQMRRARAWAWQG